MKYTVLALLGAWIIFLGYSFFSKKEDATWAFDWNSIKKQFPKINIERFECISEDELNNLKINDLPLVDSNLVNHICKQNKDFNHLKKYSKFYYYALNKVEKAEFAILVQSIDFDGIHNSVYAVQFDEKGKIINYFILAHSSNPAECRINQKSEWQKNQLIRIFKEECYETEINDIIDSTYEVLMITPTQLKEIKKEHKSWKSYYNLEGQ